MTARRRRSPAFRFLRKHPTLAVAALLGGGAGYGTDRWLDVTDRTQLYVSAVVAVLVLIVKLLLGIGYGAIYVIDSWNPWTDYTTEICGYVGKTRQRPEERIRQHLEGSTRYGTPAQPWEDTVIRWRVVHESRYMTNLGLHLRELANIRLRRPIYNYMMNMGNSRRIPKWVAIEQREERDRMRWAA
jgi:hypothetical protein